MDEKTTKLNVRYIRALIRARGMAIKNLAYRMSRSPGLVEEQLHNETVKMTFAMDMADALNVPINEITMA